jgi:hypothetical protein
MDFAWLCCVAALKVAVPPGKVLPEKAGFP